MLGLCGYNFCFDGNALDYVPTNVNELKNLQIQNGIFDNLYMTKDTTSAYDPEIPTAWDFMTLLSCDFNNNINAGNISATFANVTAFKIKRRKMGDFDWLTLAEIPVEGTQDYNFSYRDMFNANDTEYEYAIVPIMNNIEGDYIIDNVMSRFDGVFICDINTIYKFYSGVEYGNMTSIQKIGIHEPVGSKYPIIIANGDIDYRQGSIDARILNSDYIETRQINRKNIAEVTKQVEGFLKNKRAKIIKDWNGQIWLVFITSTPSISFDNSYGMGITNIAFEWTEQGDPNNQADLYANGLLEVLG